MKKAFGFMALAMALGVTAAVNAGTPAPPLAAQVSLSEAEIGASHDEVTAAASCFTSWECRMCSPFQTQNILQQTCADGTTTILQVRRCGEECF